MACHLPSPEGWLSEPPICSHTKPYLFPFSAVPLDLSFSATCGPGFLSKLPSQPADRKEEAAIPVNPDSQPPHTAIVPPVHP